MGKHNPLAYASPAVWLYDYRGNPLFDSGIYNAELALVQFKYEAVDNEEDVCEITIKSNNVRAIARSGFYRYQVVKVYWGYLDSDHNFDNSKFSSATLWIRNIRRNYTAGGIEIVLNLTDTYGLLMEEKDPTVIDKENFLETIGSIQAAIKLEVNQVNTPSGPMEIRPDQMTAWKEYQESNPWKSDKSISENKDFQTDLQRDWSGQPTEDYPYADRFPIVDPSLPDPNQKKPTEPIINKVASGVAEVLIVAPIRVAQTGGAILQNVWNIFSGDVTHAAFTLTDYLAITDPNERENKRLQEAIRAREEEQKKVQAYLDEVESRKLIQQDIDAMFKGLNLPDNVQGHGRNKLDAVKNLVDQSPDGPFNITGKEGVITVRNKSFLGVSRAYTYQGEGGDLLEFIYNSDTVYKSKTEEPEDILQVDPETGNLQIKKIANKSAGYVEISGPIEEQEYANRQAAKAWYYERIKLLHQKRLAFGDYLTIEDLGVFKAPINTGHAGYYDVNMGYKVPVETPAQILNQQVPFQTHFGKPFIDQIENEVKNELQRLKEDENKVTMKFIGDPTLGDGIIIRVNGLTPQDNGNYYITKVTHEIGDTGYYCTCEGHRPEVVVKPKSVTVTAPKKGIKKKAKARKKKLTPKADLVDCYENAVEEMGTGIIREVN